MKTILITGASRGIGRGLAERFLANGDRVIGTSTSGKMPYEHEHVVPMQLDLSNSESIKSCAATIESRGEKIDILINNAGIWSDNEGDPKLYIDMLREVLEVNLIGTADFTERILPLMNAGGHIINMSSRAGSLEYAKVPTNPDYRISKAGLNMYTRTLAWRLKDRLRVSAVQPGWVRTDMGGSDADLSVDEAVGPLFEFANSSGETGQFWFEGKKFPW